MKWFCIFLLLITPLTTWACPVCGAGQEGTRDAYVNTALLLTFMPFVFLFSTGFYIIRSTKNNKDG
jgi:hypothetical protein